MQVTSAQFESFIERHRTCKPIAEDNQKMRSSYVILDERMRFLDCSKGSKIPSNSILEVGVRKALNQIEFDSKSFLERGGRYQWSKRTLVDAESAEYAENAARTENAEGALGERGDCSGCVQREGTLDDIEDILN
jgi:hypothetical protein